MTTPKNDAAPGANGGTREPSSSAASLPSEASSSKAGFDLVERLELRGIVGRDAEFVSTGKGWQYKAGDWLYSLTSDAGRACRGLLEAHIAGAYYVGWGDWSVSLCRAEAAAALARGDEDLERIVRADLFRLAWTVRLAMINVQLLEGVDDEPEMPPARAATAGVADDVRLVIRGLGAPGRLAVARLAKRLGARVKKVTCHE